MKPNLREARFQNRLSECLLRPISGVEDAMKFYVSTGRYYIRYYTDISEDMLFVQRIRKALE